MTDISEDKIRTQLERITASAEFAAAKKMGQFLRYVVEQSLNGHPDNITQYAIAVEGLGYGKSFDPATTPNVRVMARRLRRLLEQYYLKYGTADPIRIDIPKGSYTPIFMNNLPAVQASDSFECTSSADERTPVDSFKPSIALVMFDCLNAKDEFDYVATGLTEEILIALTLFPEFLVIGPLSRDAINSQNLNAQSIGQHYGVRFLLDGSIRSAGKKLRLTIRLADTISGQQLWGKTLDLDFQDGSFIDDEINAINQLVSTIADNYGVIPRTLTKETLSRSTDSHETYDAILNYYHHFRVLTPESYLKAMNALEKTVQHNPDHALATAALGDLVATTYLFGYEEEASLLVRAEALGRKAVALDPNCQMARWTMALTHFMKLERSLFLEEAEQCLKLNPNNAAFNAVLSLHLAMVGEWDRARALMKKAMRLNPHHPGWFHIVAYMNYYRQGEYDLALIEARRFNTPDFFWDPLIRATVLGQLDRRAEAENAVNELLGLVPDFYQRGRSLIRRLAYLDEHVEMLLDGLQKAGVKALETVN